MQKLKTIRPELRRFVWDTDPRGQPRLVGALVQALRIAAVVARDTVRGPLTLQATSLVYTTLLALIPLLAVVFSVLKGFGVHNQLEPLLLNFLAPLEGKGAEVTRNILQFVSNIRVGVLGAVGVGLLLYTSVSLIQKTEQAFNSIWHVRRGRRLVRRIGDYLSIIVIGPLLVFTALGVTASLTSSGILKPLGLATLAAKIIPYLLIIGAFAFLYIFIPNARVRVRSAFVGATVAGILWQSAGWAFTAFVVGSGQYRAVYASFAILILFMIWVYLCWLIMLIGASIAFYHQHPEHVSREPRETSALLSNRRRERLGLLIARLIGDHYYTGRPPWTAAALARRLQHPLVSVEQLLDAYADNGLIARTRDTPTAYLPARALETVPLSDVLHAIRATGLEQGPDPHDPIVDAVMQKIERASGAALDRQTWRDLVTAEMTEERTRTAT